MRLGLTAGGIFQEKTIPAGARVAGWAALAREFSVLAPVRRPSCVSAQYVRGSRRDDGEWTVFDQRYWPGDTFADHLTFALRHEHMDLLVLKRVFDAAPKAEVEAFVRAARTGVHARRAWFFCEMLKRQTLDVDGAPRATVVDLLDPIGYLTGSGRVSKRHQRARQPVGRRRVLSDHSPDSGSDRACRSEPFGKGLGDDREHGGAWDRARREFGACGR